MVAVNPFYLLTFLNGNKSNIKGGSEEGLNT